MSRAWRVIVSGGGTGGHIMPAVALATQLKQVPETAVFFAGRPGSMEERIATDRGLVFLAVQSAPRGSGLGMIRNAAKNVWGFVKSLYYLLRFSPETVVCFGGYTSAPLMLAAMLLRKRAVIHDSNAIPGKVTRIFARLGASVALGFASQHPLMQDLMETAAARGGCLVTGNPLREEFRQPSPLPLDKLPNYDARKPLLLIFGGSQGAHKINLLMARAVPLLAARLPELQVAHIGGAADQAFLEASYTGTGVRFWVFPFLDELPALMRAATFCVARSGALSVTEIMASRLPSLLIPLPSAADNHQLANARMLSEKGAALLAEERNAEPAAVAAAIAGILEDPEKLEDMRRACAQTHTESAAARLAAYALNTEEGK